MSETVVARPVAESLGRRLGLMLLLGALSAFGPLSLDMYLPALPRLSADLHATPSQGQLTLTACLVGLALGQLVAGPASDARGRRRPLLAGLAAYALASALCTVAPSIWALVGLRLAQGFAGAAGIVIARAIVRDRYAGTAAARYFAALMLVNGAAPILAPLLGAGLLKVTSWRGVFWVLAGVGAVLLLAVAAGLAETLPPERRRAGGFRSTAAGFHGLLTDRGFVGTAGSAGLVLAGMFGYIAGSSFVLQDIYRLSPQQFGLVFAVNACGIVALSQLSRFVVHRVGPLPLMRTGVYLAAAGGLALLVAVLAGAGLPGILPALFTVVASVGLVMPNSAALALAPHADRAGSASALLGSGQLILGAVVAPLVGLAGAGTAVPMAVVVCAAELAALAVFTALVAPRPATSSPRP